jgi:hypothetical protein
VNMRDIGAKITLSLVTCRTCEERIDCWPDADPSEHGQKLIYSAREGLFGGICSLGHINEFYLPEAKAEEYVAHDITERTLGKFTQQDECGHEKHTFMQVPGGLEIPSNTGMIVGPTTVKFCGLCGNRSVHEGKKEAR